MFVYGCVSAHLGTEESAVRGPSTLIPRIRRGVRYLHSGDPVQEGRGMGSCHGKQGAIRHMRDALTGGTGMTPSVLLSKQTCGSS